MPPLNDNQPATRSGLFRSYLPMSSFEATGWLPLCSAVTRRPGETKYRLCASNRAASRGQEADESVRDIAVRLDMTVRSVQVTAHRRYRTSDACFGVDVREEWTPGCPDLPAAVGDLPVDRDATSRDYGKARDRYGRGSCFRHFWVPLQRAVRVAL